MFLNSISFRLGGAENACDIEAKEFRLTASIRELVTPDVASER
jgi:hypothetical protein